MINKRKIFFEKNKELDKWMVQIGFHGYSSQETYEHLKKFLKNNGFGDIPLPESSRRLWWDYLKPDDEGYEGSFKWHPIEISQHPYHTNGLQLNISNEFYPDHMPYWEGTMGKGYENQSRLFHHNNLEKKHSKTCDRLFENYDFLLYDSNIFYSSKIDSVVDLYLTNEAEKEKIDYELQSTIEEFNNKSEFSREEKLTFIARAREFIDLYSSYCIDPPFEILDWEKFFIFLKLLLPHLKIQNDITENGISLKNIETCIEGITNNYLDSIISGKNTIGIERRHSEEWDYYFDIFIGEFVNGLPHGFFVLKNEVNCIVEEAVYIHGELLAHYNYDFFDNDEVIFNPLFSSNSESKQSLKTNITKTIKHEFSNIKYPLNLK